MGSVRRTRPSRLRLWGPAILGLAILGACAGPRLQVASAPSQPSLTLTQAGIRLTLLPNSWQGYPADLTRSYTPMEVEIANESAQDVEVRYADFLAIDETRTQFRAVPPAEVVRALFGSRPRPPLVRRAPPAPRLVALHDPWWGYPFWPFRSGPPYYSPYYPFRYPDPDYPGWPRATAYDILTRALREGRLLAGARVRGFLYLQQATERGSLLTLSWTPVGPDGKPLATFSAEFRIVR